MITKTDRRMLAKWEKVAKELEPRELEIAAHALSTRHAQLSLERAFSHKRGDPPAPPSFAFEIDREKFGDG